MEVNTTVNEAHGGLPFAVRLGGYDYARAEYGLTREETDRLSRRMKAEVARTRSKGALREVKTVEDLG